MLASKRPTLRRSGPDPASQIPPFVHLPGNSHKRKRIFPPMVPPPPARDSTQASAEIAELKAVETSRSSEQAKAAREAGETTTATIFAGVLGPRFDL
ncbi:hypothetical protein HCH44_13115 [Sphingomonas melonis]|jgi:hypothetical protein|nr:MULTISPECIES: hypothetical protein [Sphingomonas]MBX8845851.1 hypothetical protein [Sphingomonas melonis]